MKTKAGFDGSFGGIVWNILLVLTAVALITATGCGSRKTKMPVEPAAAAPAAYQEAAVKMIPAVEGRGWPERVLYYENIAVEHEALYLKGPFEKQGGEDGYFRTWDWGGCFSIGASPLIFVGETFLLPISMVIAPPWQMQYSRSDYPVVEPAYELPGEPSGMAEKEREK